MNLNKFPKNIIICPNNGEYKIKPVIIFLPIKPKHKCQKMFREVNWLCYLVSHGSRMVLWYFSPNMLYLHLFNLDLNHLVLTLCKLNKPE